MSFDPKTATIGEADAYRAGLAAGAAAMREAAAREVSTGDHCRYVDHFNGSCDCAEMAAAIRALPLPEAKP